MGQKVIFAIAVTLVTLRSGNAITVRPATPSVTEDLLASIATGDPTPRTIAIAIRDCVRVRILQPRCEQGITRVLHEYSAAGEASESLVRQGLDLAERGSDDGAASARRVRAGISLAAEPVSTTYSPNPTGDTDVPRREDQGRVTLSAWHSRLDHFISPLLPSNAADRVTRAFEIADASSCERAFEGASLDVCNDVGIAAIGLSALRLTLRPMVASEGRKPVLRPFLLVSQDLFEPVLIRYGHNDDQLVAGALSLIARWRVTTPSRWRAWADLEAMFGER